MGPLGEIPILLLGSQEDPVGVSVFGSKDSLYIPS